MIINNGHTVHVVPGEHGSWNVVDLRRHGSNFPTRSAAVERAKQIAAASQPSQVVLVDALGNFKQVARFQLPQYRLPPSQDEIGESPFEAVVKAMVIGGIVAAGVAVLGELVERVERDAKKAARKPKGSAKGIRRSRRA